MTDTTPIPAGALTVDDVPSNAAGDLFAVRLHDERFWCWVTFSQRARLLAGPDRPTGVPDDAVPAGPEAWWIQQADGRWRLCLRQTWTRAAYPAAFLREHGVPVPPYQPTPDPADSPTHKCVAHPDDGHCVECGERCRENAPVAAGERTGPLGLSEEYPELALLETRERVREVARITDDELDAWQITAIRNLVEACRAAVAEWDADTTPPTPNPDHITVNRADLSLALETAKPLMYPPEWRRAVTNLRAALAAAGESPEPPESSQP